VDRVGIRRGLLQNLLISLVVAGVPGEITLQAKLGVDSAQNSSCNSPRLDPKMTGFESRWPNRSWLNRD
jgi:hypothetical protein